MLLAWDIFKGSRFLQAATALFVAWAALKGNNIYQRNVGEQRAEIKQEKADNNALAQTQAAGRKSSDPAVRGVRDPNSVD